MNRRIIRAAGLALAAIGVLAIIPSVILAVAHSVNYTAGQDTLIQSRLVPAYNRAHCAKFGRPAGCSSANLVSSGCVTVSLCSAIGLPPASAACTTLSGLNVESCVIYTTDTTGEDALLQELLSQDFARVYLDSKNQSRTDFINAFAAGTGTQQNNSCTAIGLASGCDGP
jgi:hypothetical protein